MAVSGASGQTGLLVVQKLLARPDEYQPVALVRSEEGADTLCSIGVPRSSIHSVDITKTEASTLKDALTGCRALIICTSAVPERVPSEQPGPPTFVWKHGQTPEQVDWLGQKLQIEVARDLCLEKVVLVSSMGGCNKDHMLNKIGDGNILQWKRRAEQYLMASGMSYTILHPGGLVNDKGGERAFILGVDDQLLNNSHRTIPREDLAELCVNCLAVPAATNRSVDVITGPAGEGKPTWDFQGLFAAMPQNCDYTINPQL